MRRGGRVDPIDNPNRSQGAFSTLKNALRRFADVGVKKIERRRGQNVGIVP